MDLCAAPGSWSQVLSRKLFLPALRAGNPNPPTIVAVDLQVCVVLCAVLPVRGVWVAGERGWIGRREVTAAALGALGTRG